MTIDLRNRVPSVYIDLPVGVYVLPASSTSGKTYLCNALRQFGVKARVGAYTYNEPLIPEELFNNDVRDLVMLDRYDLYSDVELPEMWKFAESGIVLLDCKSNLISIQAKPCVIIMRKDELVVMR